jgi:hypothetical protein
MSLLKHYTNNKAATNTSTALTITSNAAATTNMNKTSDIEPETELINITVEDLNTIVNLPPNADPFIVYLYTYIQNLTLLLDSIYEIKKAEKSLKLRLKQAEKLLNSLLSTSVEIPLDTPVNTEIDLDATVESEVTPSSIKSPQLKMVQNIGDFS